MNTYLLNLLKLTLSYLKQVPAPSPELVILMDSANEYLTQADEGRALKEKLYALTVQVTVNMSDMPGKVGPQVFTIESALAKEVWEAARDEQKGYLLATTLGECLHEAASVIDPKIDM